MKPTMVGRWLLSGKYLQADESAMDGPILMLKPDGTGSMVDPADYLGHWEVMTTAMNVGHEPGPVWLARTEQAKADNYYYSDYVGSLHVGEGGAARYVDRGVVSNGRLQGKREPLPKDWPA